MMKDKFLIGELAKMFNISTDTLRHYDHKNLLKPEQSTENNYRYYDINSMFKLSRILFLKNLDISLNEIANYMNNKNADRLFTMLKKKDQEIDQKIQQLTNLKYKINSKLDLLQVAKTKLGKIMVMEIPERKGIFLKTYGLKDAIEAKEVFRKSDALLKMSSWLVEGEVYTSITKEDMEQGVFNQFRYFVEIEAIDPEVEKQLIILPQSIYACLTINGPYEQLHVHYQTLIDWIEQNNYQIIGDSIENNIVDSDYSDSKDEFITEIQIPIKIK